MAVRGNLWGEIPKSTSATANDCESMLDLLKEDVVYNIIRESCRPDQPKISHSGDTEPKELLPQSSSMDADVLYTIRLQRHASVLRQLIATAKERIQSQSTPKQHLPPVPAMPIQEKKELRHSRMHPGNYVPLESTPFTRGEGKAPENLTEESAKKILTKSVCTIAAHIGFDGASEDCILTLRDTASEFLHKLTSLMRVAVEHQTLQGTSGFADAMEEAFYTMGLGSIRTLHSFYQNRIVGFRERSEQLCFSLSKEYEELSNQHNRSLPPSPWDNVPIKAEVEIKQEDVTNEEEEVPELHVPAAAEIGFGLSSSFSLRSGFQMLQSLERQQLMVDDEAIVDEEIIKENDFDDNPRPNKRQRK